MSTPHYATCLYSYKLNIFAKFNDTQNVIANSLFQQPTVPEHKEIVLSIEDMELLKQNFIKQIDNFISENPAMHPTILKRKTQVLKSVTNMLENAIAIQEPLLLYYSDAFPMMNIIIANQQKANDKCE